MILKSWRTINVLFQIVIGFLTRRKVYFPISIEISDIIQTKTEFNLIVVIKGTQQLQILLLPLAAHCNFLWPLNWLYFFALPWLHQLLFNLVSCNNCNLISLCFKKFYYYWQADCTFCFYLAIFEFRCRWSELILLHCLGFSFYLILVSCNNCNLISLYFMKFHYYWQADCISWLLLTAFIIHFMY